MTVTMPRPTTRFALAAGSEASAPPERRGVPRDGVRLLVARGGSPSNRLQHRHFHDLPEQLAAGDVLVVNTSATLAAAVDGLYGGRKAPVHVSTQLDEETWVVEIRLPDNSGPDLTAAGRDRVLLPGGVKLRLLEPFPEPGADRSRLWRARVDPAVAATGYLAAHGRPIGYRYLAGRYPLADYQTVYANTPGSAEMASAGRPFTTALLTRVAAAGVTIAPLVLHAGVSSPELHEPPAPEWFSVPADTARLVNSGRAAGRRVVAVGTTAVRALESATDRAGVTHAAGGWTSLVLGPERAVRVTGGLITGWHAPEASHLLLLEAVAGADLVAAAYAAATAGHYLWHEFGDSALLLP